MNYLKLLKTFYYKKIIETDVLENVVTEGVELLENLSSNINVPKKSLCSSLNIIL